MTRRFTRPGLQAAALALPLLLLLLGGCASGLLPKRDVQPTLLALDDAGWRAAPPAAPAGRAAASLTLIVDSPRAAAGLDTRYIAYLRRAHEVEYFALHQWVDTPARMLAPLIVRGLERDGMFRAVVRAPSAASGDWRLESELVHLQQDFTAPASRVRLTLRAHIVDIASRRLVAAREFDISVASPSADPYGGAQAANAAVRQLVDELALFCAQTAAAR